MNDTVLDVNYIKGTSKAHFEIDPEHEVTNDKQSVIKRRGLKHWD